MVKEHKDIRTVYKYFQGFEYKKSDSDVKKQIIKDIFDICSDELDSVTFKKCDDNRFTIVRIIFHDGYEIDFNISNEHN